MSDSIVPAPAFVKAVLLPESRDRLLLQRRTKRGDRYHGFWELPGGRIHDGESVHEALTREVEEETGMAVEQVLGQPTDQIEDRLGGRARVLSPLVVVEVTAYGPIFGQYYACLVGGEARDTEEGSFHRWFTIPEFRRAFLDSPGAPDMGAATGLHGTTRTDELSTVDLLAMRVIFRDRLLDPFLQ